MCGQDQSRNSVIYHAFRKKGHDLLRKTMFDTLQEKITIVIVSGERNIIDYIKTDKYTHSHIYFVTSDQYQKSNRKNIEEIYVSDEMFR